MPRGERVNTLPSGEKICGKSVAERRRLSTCVNNLVTIACLEEKELGKGGREKGPKAHPFATLSRAFSTAFSSSLGNKVDE